jgi:hypothetical protein
MQLSPRIDLKRRHWPFAVGCVALAILSVGPIIMVTAAVVSAAAKGLPLPADWTWSKLWLTDGVLAALCAGGIWHLRRQFQVYFSEAGVHQGRRFMSWDEILEIRRVPQFSIELRGAHGKMAVNCWAFASPPAVFALIKERARHAREA